VVESQSLEALRSAHTALVSDVCDDMGVSNPLLARTIQRVAGIHDGPVVGPAYPCLVEPTDAYVEIDRLLEMVGSIPAGSVPLVVGVEGFPAALWGGLMSAGAVRRGAMGAVTNGLVRDIDQIERLGFPVFGTGRTALDIRRRGAMRAFDVAVDVGTRRVVPGDVVVADGNGVAVVERGVADEVAARCAERLAGEEATLRGLLGGASPRRLFDEFGQF
jgi:4-hydroxy-4-methyl-2-oxoglutarate aldolase